jgi:DNA-binding NtrC family response regulator
MTSNEPVHSQNGNTIVEPPPRVPVDTMPDESVPISLDDRLRAFEASLITWALTASSGNKSRAARLLNIKRSTLGDRIHRCGLDHASEPVSVEERR